MNRQIKYLAPAISILAMLGCSTPPMMPEPMRISETATNRHYLPPLDRSSTVSVGENMYVEYSETVTKISYAKVLGEAVADMDMGTTLRVLPGYANVLRTVYSTSHKAACFPSVATNILESYEACLVDQEGGGNFTHAIFKNRRKYFELKEPVRYVVSQEEASKIELPEFKYQVLYQGLSKGSIKISFREFMKETARPAFTQDIAYDIDPSGTTIIAFKDLRIKVLKATASDITYAVIKPFK